jgi:hypothetical protein
MSNRALRLSVLALSLAACTSSDGSSTRTVTGIVAIGEPIAGATVYADFGDANIIDNDEDRVVTDATGHFTLTWDDHGSPYPFSVGAIVRTTSTRVGVTGADATVGFTIHLSAPLGAPVDDNTAIITPLSTLVASEVRNAPTLRQPDLEAKIATALSTSQLPFSGQPLDVMADYATDAGAGTATSADSQQLRFTAGAVAALLSAAIDGCNTEQQTFDCNDAMIFDPFVVAMDEQLTPIANGTFTFSQLSPSAQADVFQNPGNYHDYFVNTQMMADEVEAELEAAAEDAALAVFEQIKDEIIAKLEEDIVRLVAGELIAFALGG